MKTWELIKALQEGKYISHPDYEGGRKVRLKDIDKSDLVFENATYAGELIVDMVAPLNLYSSIAGRCAERGKIVEDIIEVNGVKYKRIEE